MSIFPLEILIPACESSSLAFCMMYSAYKLNKQGGSIQPWPTPFPVLNQSIVSCLVLTVASCPAYRFHRRQVRWSGSPISFQNFSTVCVHTVKGFSVVNEAKVDVFLEFPCFFCDPADVGNLTSGSSAFFKSNLNIWKFSVHVLLNPNSEYFHSFYPPLPPAFGNPQSVLWICEFRFVCVCVFGFHV